MYTRNFPLVPPLFSFFPSCSCFCFLEFPFFPPRIISTALSLRGTSLLFLAVHSLLRLVNPVFLSKRLSPLFVGSRSSSSLSQPSCSLYTRFTSPLCTTILLSSLFRRFQPDVPALEPRVHVLSDARGSNVRARDHEGSVHAGVGHVRAALFAPNAFMGRASRALLVPPLVAPLTKTSSFDRVAKNWLIENSSYRQTFNILLLYYVPWNQKKSEWNRNASTSGSPWISQESARKLRGCKRSNIVELPRGIN